MRIRNIGRRDYLDVYTAMQTFTAERNADTPDELWRVEHPPVFTQGLNGKPEHILNPGDIPVVPVDRGGQITYHGPGQIVIYCLLDMRRAGLGVRQLVTLLEQSIIDLLVDYRINGYAKPEAPGVYVHGRKIASLGLRIRRACSYHGISLNVAMDLEPFSRINPCGYPGLEITQLSTLGVTDSLDTIAAALLAKLSAHLGYTNTEIVSGLPNHANQESEHA